MKLNNDILKISVIALLFIWICWGFAGFLLLVNDEGSKAGVFGDFFGGFNALISILGFGTVIYSILKSKEDALDDHDRHLQNLKQQQDILESQKATAIWQEKSARIASVAANLEAHSAIHRNALNDNEENQKFCRRYASILYEMKNETSDIKLYDWLSFKMSSHDIDLFGFECVKFHPQIIREWHPQGGLTRAG